VFYLCIVQDFVKKMLKLNPKQRMTAKQALRHPWVTGVAAKNDHLPLTQEGLKKFNGTRKLRVNTMYTLKMDFVYSL